MKKFIILLIVFSIVCLVPVLAVEVAQPDDITKSQDAVQKISLVYKDKIKYTGTEKTSHGKYDKFSTPDGSDYYVNTASKTIDRVDKKFSWKQTKETQITQKEAVDAAKNYINKYSAGHKRADMNTVSTRLLDHGSYNEYSMEFRQMIDGVAVPNIALVSVDPSNGEMLSYMSIYQDVTVSLIPEIPMEHAVDIATSQYPGIREVSHEISLEVTIMPDGGQKLVWMITLVGESVDNHMYGGYLVVDALNGNVLYNSPFN